MIRIPEGEEFQLLRACTDSCITPALGAAFRKFFASESNFPNNSIERVIPREPFGPGLPTKHTFEFISVQVRWCSEKSIELTKNQATEKPDFDGGG